MKNEIRQEVEEWCDHYGVVCSFEQTVDLVLTIYELLDDGRILPRDMPETVNADDEHYNTTTYIQ